MGEMADFNVSNEELEKGVEFYFRKHQELMAAVAVLMGEAEQARVSMCGLQLLLQGRRQVAAAAEVN